MDSLISVIVPVYNVEKYFDKCIQSIVEQTYNKLEIILVDDGSTDSCSQKCDEWGKKDQRIIVIHKKNGGLSDARNCGLKAASGEYIGFVDSDDWIAPEMYEKLKSALGEDDSDISACTVRTTEESGELRELLTIKKRAVLSRLQAQKALLEETDLKQPVWYKLYRKHTLDGVLFEKGKQHEDVYWSYLVVGSAKRISLIEYEGYFYRQRQKSIMGKG